MHLKKSFYVKKELSSQQLSSVPNYSAQNKDQMLPLINFLSFFENTTTGSRANFLSPGSNGQGSNALTK